MNSIFRYARQAAAAGLFLLISAMAAPASAGAHTCGSNWCSGSDNSTTNNTQGNADQIYMGESGVYYLDAGGSGSHPSCPGAGKPDYACFINSAASSAQSKWNAGTGLGVGTVYLGGGAASQYESGFSSAYCFGAWQGYKDEYYTYNDDLYQPDLVTAIDIEQNNTFGWSSATQTQNRQVYNGFINYVSGGNTNCGLPANPMVESQYAVYSSPDQWSYSFGTGSNASIPNSLEWTYEPCCSSSWPGANWGGSFSSFGGSSYDWMRQFDQNPDYDDAVEPIYMPVLGISYGN